MKISSTGTMSVMELRSKLDKNEVLLMDSRTKRMDRRRIYRKC